MYSLYIRKKISFVLPINFDVVSRYQVKLSQSSMGLIFLRIAKTIYDNVTEYEYDLKGISFFVYILYIIHSCVNVCLINNVLCDKLIAEVNKDIF